MSSNISDKRLKEVLAYLSCSTKEDTLNYFKIKNHTLTDYISKGRKTLHTNPQPKKLENVQDLDCKILLFDIETAPSIGYFWNRWKEDISQIQVIREGFVNCYAAKWLGSDEMIVDALPFYEKDYANDPENDYNVIKSLYELIDKADIVVAHFGDGFDMPIVRTRFVYHGFKPYSQAKQIDTVKLAKALFKFPSNKLNDLGIYLGLGQKVETGGFQLWKDCDKGDMAAWQKMITYNEMDVTLLEKVYLKLRAWDKRHPNVGIYTKTIGMKCNVCGSSNLILNSKLATTNISAYESYTCQNCGAKKRSRYNVRSKEQMKNTLANIV